MYDSTRGCWVFTTPMNTSRSWCGAGVIQNRIYVVGGGHNIDSHRSAECFEHNQWTYIAQMWHPRGWCRVAVLNECIYAFGGFNIEEVQPPEVYNPVQNSWTVENQLHIARMLFAITSIDEKILMIGGNNIPWRLTPAYCDRVLLYDTYRRTWSLLLRPMRISRDFPEVAMLRR